ncbi:nuclear transport factor 2 family protein [Labrys okinawensis]|uniref:nuclear transport factor 2 family protein n=1 Tax=Labrys okinawensis TaxID=346911 RepID=UPI0039BC8497
MSDRDRIEAMVRETYARRCAGDIDGFMAMFGPEPRFRLAGDEILGDLTVEIRGHKDVRAVLERLTNAWDWSDYRVDAVVVDGDRAVVHGKGTMFYVPKQQRIATETLDILTIADGKITDFVEFCDTHMAARAMDLLPV